MRCSSTALVLGTLAIGQAAAGTIRHANFHARRHAEAQGQNEVDVGKRDDPYANVDWSKIDWTKVVDWATVSYTYSSGQSWSEATSAPAAAAPAPTTTLISVVAAQAVYSSTPAAVVSSAAPVSSVAPAVSPAAASTGGGDIVSEVLSAVDSSNILSLGLKAIGTNSKTNNGAIWIGDDGDYTNEFTNAAGEDIVLVCWGSDGSWVNAIVPLITVSIPDGGKTTLSFANGNSGACAPIYPDTELVDGQISNTWLEHTYGPSGVLDVSREVNMSGHSIEAVGPSCTTNMEQCVFVCDSGNTCLTGYSLKNCANGSQAGANYGQYDGADSGGCGGLGNQAAIKTTFS
ncbi:hypothetical protein AOQ84DRAFT_436628 [Glonium stellatum]|uniref:Uncharacterized protein n=1 Tax=Glonium stellatum TaxID=574774 RepID=A0A8E2F9B2_9PEZI|nr:hypothetical protein AOQ84DRAFT_436628 [Glonium stellatum]